MTRVAEPCFLLLMLLILLLIPPQRVARASCVPVGAPQTTISRCL